MMIKIEDIYAAYVTDPEAICVECGETGACILICAEHLEEEDYDHIKRVFTEDDVLDLENEGTLLFCDRCGERITVCKPCKKEISVTEDLKL